MNRALRKAHLRYSLALALCLPVGIVAALLGRPDAALTPRRDQPNQTPAVGGRKAIALGSLEALGLELRWLPGLAGAASQVQLLHSQPALVAKPDVLVYVLAGGDVPEGDMAPPQSARLLGGWNGAPSQLFDLPALGPGAGQVAFYSLAHEEWIGSLPLPEGAR